MIDLKPASRQMIHLLAAVTDDQLADPTPCKEYTVADLIAHVEEVAHGFTAIARKDGDRLTARPAADSRRDQRWRDRVGTSVRALGDAWDEPSAWDGATDAAGVELPNELWGKIALTELVVHGWDIARATGSEFELPEDTLRACLDHVVEFVPQAPLPQLWGPPVDVPHDAPLIDRIVAITGRTPSERHSHSIGSNESAVRAREGGRGC